jgi:hypothetical protein
MTEISERARSSGGLVRPPTGNGGLVQRVGVGQHVTQGVALAREGSNGIDWGQCEIRTPEKIATAIFQRYKASVCPFFENDGKAISHIRSHQRAD